MKSRSRRSTPSPGQLSDAEQARRAKQREKQRRYRERNPEKVALLTMRSNERRSAEARTRRAAPDWQDGRRSRFRSELGDNLSALGKKLEAEMRAIGGRLDELTVLSPRNDPFRMDSNTRHREGEMGCATARPRRAISHYSCPGIALSARRAR